MRNMCNPQIPMSTRIFAGLLAAGITTICASMAAVSAIERASDLLGAAIFAVIAVVMVVGAHVLPSLVRRNWIAQGVFLVCIGVTLYNQAFFFDSCAKGTSALHQTQAAMAQAKVNATLATWIGIKTETITTSMAFLQFVVLEVVGALLWAVALPRQHKKVQEVRVKHLVSYHPQAKCPRPQTSRMQKMLAYAQAQPRDSPLAA